ncbi:ABC transporter substrate-binding protein [Paenibacillus selenitireducens]|jgi:multiple sugar transport system substrate-binding protein|uniref:ABC transporter substrate-binding protein n=1 Tax=Paenibacillus selenitireducens TaxID=1324314 RepID=A0A1T2X792_9BACL|nr:sugar ABC transporter substrate-binding protein [Paenibacillus selenitireducens]OPA75744.1 ABC transporter substrate-binding protein [Paenibacillus selenitireducens]
MKKWAILLALTMMTTVVLSACGTKSETKEENGSSASGNKEVVELKFTAWGDVSSNPAEAKLAEEFNKTHDNIKVKFEPVPGDGYGTKLTTSLAAGQAPDVFLIGEGDFYKYVDKGVVEPLDDHLAKDSAFKTDIFQQDLLNMGRIHDKLYYLPKDFNPLSLWYNKSMFDEAGIPYPSNDWTWDDLTATAKKLTAKDASGKYTKFGFNATKWEYPIYTYLWSNGASIANEDGSKAEGFMNSDKTIAALQKYVDMSIGADKVSPTPQDTETMGGDSSMFMTNKLAMMVTGRWVKSDLDKSDVKYGTALIPKGADGERAGIIAAAGWAINANSKNKEAAYELVKFLSGTEAQKLRSEEGKVLPATVAELDEVKKTEVADQPVIEMMNFAKKPVTMVSSNGPIFVEEFTKALEKILLKKSTVQDALNEAAKTIDSKVK